MSDVQPSIAVQWNALALDAIRLGLPKPTEITRAMHIAHSAMYDAWAAYDDEAVGAYSDQTATGTQAQIAHAVSVAAHAALRVVFSDYKFLFDKFFDGLEVPEGAADAAAVGQAAAQAVLAARANDGSNWDGDYEDISGYEAINDDAPAAMDDPDFDPNAWTPLRVPNGTVRDADGIPIATDNPATYDLQKAISPHWGDVTPFAIDDGDVFRPVAPPKLGDFSTYIDAKGTVTTGDAAYREQFGNLVEISANLTAEHKAIAEYWADGPQSSTPPGHWNEIAHDLSVREGYGLADDVKMFFALNNALFDTGIAVWDAKYAHDYVRPQTAIQYLYRGQEIETWAGPNKGTQTLDGLEWQPYQDVTFVTPAFPEYTSGHSGFSYAAATVLAAYTGSDTYYDGTSRGAYDLDADGTRDLIGQWTTDELAFEEYDGAPITLEWATLWDAAAEAGSSRLYGGIHIQDGDLRAREMGAQVGEVAWAASLSLFERNADNTYRVVTSKDRLILGDGEDAVMGSADELNGLHIADFTQLDRIEIRGLTLAPQLLGVREGSAILEIDSNADGVIDSEITLEGDFTDERFKVESFNGTASVTLATSSDIILTDASERFITTDNGPNAIAAGDGTDIVLGAGGNDIIDGDAGDDVLRGGDDDDILIGAGGLDEVTGGDGADIFSFSATDEVNTATPFIVDRITDFTPGTDTVELAGFDASFTFASFNFTQVASGLSLELPDGRFLVFEGITDPAVFSASDFTFPAAGRDISIAGKGAQRLTDSADRYVSAGDVADDIDARGGNDAIVTGNLDDSVNAGLGDDLIISGSGADLVRPGGGLDVITTGTGNDRVVFNYADDPVGGFIRDEVTDYVAGEDVYQFIGFPGITSFADVTFSTVASGLAMDLGNGRFVVFAGVADQADLNPADFDFGGSPPQFDGVALANDTGANATDRRTSDPTINGNATDDNGLDKLEIQFTNGGPFYDVTSAVDATTGDFSLTRAVLEAAAGAEFLDGTFSVTLRATDLFGATTSLPLSFTLDSTPPQITTAPGSDNGGTLSATTDMLVLEFNERIDTSGIVAGDFVLSRTEGTAPAVTSVDVVNPTTLQLNLAATLGDGDYSLAVDPISDVAGNTLTPDAIDFSVSALTSVVATGPTDGASRANLDRKITVEFDRPVDADTITTESIKVMASGQALAGRVDLSSNGTIATFFPEALLPGGSTVRIKVDGDQIMAADGKMVDADGDGTAGGMLEADFSTVTLTRVPNTNLEGFIFDANYTDDDDLDIPLEGVVVKVIGLPGVQAVTDANGRFFLEDLPIPEVYLDFDASNVVNRPNFDYGTIVKPVSTSAGQTVGLASGDKAFNIYFAALAEADTVALTPGEENVVGIGALGLANLEDVFPGIDPGEWEKLKVTIPADSLTRDDGTAVDEVQIMAFSPDRIPAPLPANFDPTVVFTVKAGDATNVDGKAQIEMPNVDELPLGAKRPIMSFDHDAGVWVQTGTAVVVDDGDGGTVLRSEGDTGVNTLGWKAIGPEPTKPLDDKPKTHSDLGVGSAGFETFRQGTSAVLSYASTATGFIDTAESGVDVVIPDGPVLTPIDLALTGIGAGLGIASDLVGTGEVGDETWAGIGLSLAGDGLNALEVPGEIAGTASTAAANALSIKGSADATKRAIDAGSEFGGALSSWADMFGNSVSDFLSDINPFARSGSGDAVLAATGVQSAIGDDPVSTAAQDYAVERIDEIIAAIDKTQRGLELQAEVYETYFAIDRWVQSLTTPDPAALSQADLIAKIEATRDLIDQFVLDFPERDFREIFRNARSELETAASEFEEITDLALEGATTVYYAVELANNVVLRGVTTDGQIDVQVPVGETISVSYFAPTTGFVREATFNTGETTDPQELETTIFERDLVDNDDDGLGAIAEFVLGTREDRADTDGDGIKDGAEVEQGLNPLDGVGFPTGIIGSTDLLGEALDVVVEGNLMDTSRQTAYVATGSHGLATIDASNFVSPIVLSQLDLPGDNRMVTVDVARGLAFMAAGNVGLHVIDVSDPVAPALVQTVPFAGGIFSVVSSGGALLAGGRDLYVLNPASGDVLFEAGLSGRINDIAVDGDTVYAIVDNARLMSFAFNGQQLVELGTVDFPTGTIRTIPDDKQIFIDGGVAYIANGLEVSNVPLFRDLERGGYLTYDVENPTAMALISNIDTPRVQAGNLETITNGAGLALVAGGFRGLQVHNANDPENTYDLVTEFATPGNAEAVALASGIAYVADGIGGLQVINVLPFDAAGQAPTVSIDTDAIDADPDTAGLQIQEGSTVRLDLAITDDVQIRNVELLLDGVVVVNDVSAPYDLSFIVPALSAGATVVEATVRATDTGGNTTTSSPITLNIIPDITPPEVVSISPSEGKLVLVGDTTFSVVFNEPIDPTTVDASNFAITPAAGGAPINPVDLAFLANDSVLQLTFADLDLGDYSVEFALGAAADRAGNVTGDAPVTRAFEVVDANAVWLEPTGGTWDEVAKWRDGTLPVAQDGVAIVLNDGATLAIRNADVDISQMRLSGVLALENRTLSVDVLNGSDGALQMAGGTLQNSTINGTDSFEVVIGSGNWSNNVLNGKAVSADTGFGSFIVRDGLVVNGSLEVSDTTSFSSRLFLEPVQTIGGTGEIFLNGSGASLRLLGGDFLVTETLVFDSDLTLRGSGRVDVTDSQDRVQILGSAVGDDGTLSLGHIDNQGMDLRASSTADGAVEIYGPTEGVDLVVAADADVRVIGSLHTDMEIKGPGVARIGNAQFDGLTITSQAVLEPLSASGGIFTTINDDLTVNGTLSLSAAVSQSVQLFVLGEQTVDGTGEIVLTRDNAAVGEVVGNFLRFSNSSIDAERLTFGEDLTLRGEGTIDAVAGNDRIQVLGTAVGEGTGLVLNRLDNVGETLTVDSAAGQVRVGLEVENTVFVGTTSSDLVDLANSADLLDVTFDVDARLNGAAQSSFVRVESYGGLTINGTFSVAAALDGSAYLYAYGSQTIGGTGTLLFSEENIGAGAVNNRLSFQGEVAEAEVLTLGADLTVAGNGLFQASGAGDTIQILGTVEGRGAGSLRLTDIDNGGAAMAVDTSDGAVEVTGTVANVDFTDVTGETGSLTLGNGAVLDGVSLLMDATMGVVGTSVGARVSNGLTLDGDVTVQASLNRSSTLRFDGEQTIEGTGRIVLSDAFDPAVNTLLNDLTFIGTLTSQEMLTIGSGVEVIGEGRVTASGSIDLIGIEGAVMADNGRLQVTNLAAVEGRIGATDDGLLQVTSGGLDLTQRTTLEVGFAGTGDDARAGRIDVTGVLEQQGTLAFNVAAGFDAAIGTTFDILTTTGTISDAFNDFQGFDLAGNKAFELITVDGDTLQARVTTDATAASRGFINRDVFTPPPRPVDTRTDLSTDTLDGTVVRANVIGRETGTGPVEVLSPLLSDVALSADLMQTAFASDDDVTVEKGLLLNDVDVTAGSAFASAFAQWTFRGEQSVDGTGVLNFDRDATGRSPQHQLVQQAQNAASERLIFGENVTLKGHAAVLGASGVEDAASVFGIVESVAGSTFTLSQIDNDGGTLRVDTRAGEIVLEERIRNTVFEGVDGNSGVIDVEARSLKDVTFGTDAAVNAADGAQTVDVFDGLTLDGSTLSVEGWGASARLDFYQTQLVDGTGTILLAANPDSAGTTVNSIQFRGVAPVAEDLTFGEQITLRGTGEVFAQSATDKIKILGTVAAEGGDLILRDVDNEGATLNIDTTAGTVAFEGLRDTQLVAVPGSTGFVELLGSASLTAVSLGIDAEFMRLTRNDTLTINDGLTLDGVTLTVGGSARAGAEVDVVGPQNIDGTGEILLSDRFSIDGREVRNAINFVGTDSDLELFEIGQDVTLRGEGTLSVSDGDMLDINGRVVADSGLLTIGGVETFDGALEVTAQSTVAFDAGVGFAADASVAMGLSGGGFDRAAGQITAEGQIVRAGSFAFDIADDFAGALGTEILLMTATDGFGDQFSSVTGATFGDSLGLALIEDGESLFARVVNAGQAGQQLNRLDVPIVTPNTRDGDVTGETLDTAWAGGPSAFVTFGTWSNVVLNATAILPREEFASLTVRDGLTVNGAIVVEGEQFSFSSVLYADIGQTLGGTGEIVLVDQNAILQLNRGTFGTAEQVVLGSDLTLRGSGQINVSDAQDRFQILGSVVGDDGTLSLRYIDNNGEDLRVASTADGAVELSGPTESVDLVVAAGSDVRVINGLHTDMEIKGPGTARIASAQFDNLTVTGQAEFENLSNFGSVSAQIEDLTVNGTLLVSGALSQQAFVSITGTQTVGGTGEIVMTRNNAADDEAITNVMRLLSSSADVERLTFGEDLTLRGEGEFTASSSDDRIQVLGTAVGEGTGLLLSRLDNVGETLTVDSSAGLVRLGLIAENTVLDGATATDMVAVQNGTDLIGVTFNLDAKINGAESGSFIAADFRGGLVINDTFTLAAAQDRGAYIYAYGTQTIGGNGTLLFSEENIGAGTVDNRLSFQSELAEAEVLTLGANLTVAGNGLFQATGANDTIRILGTVEGRGNGSLRLTDIDNGGAAMAVDTSDGAVAVTGTVANVDFVNVTGETGSLTLGNGAVLDGVSLLMDATLGVAGTSVGARIANGLTLGGDITVEASESRVSTLRFDGEQTIDGTGRIVLSDAFDPAIDTLLNDFTFVGTVVEQETLTIGSGIEVIGEGRVTASGSSDLIAIEGAMIADNGRLQVTDLAAVEGRVGATDDGVMLVTSGGLDLTATSTLEIGFAGSGDAARGGRVEVNGALEQEGTLAFDVATGFDAEIGTVFDILTASGGLTGNYSDVQGLDFAGDKRFEVFSPDADTLSVRVIADPVAAMILDDTLL